MENRLTYKIVFSILLPSTWSKQSQKKLIHDLFYHLKEYLFYNFNLWEEKRINIKKIKKKKPKNPCNPINNLKLKRKWKKMKKKKWLQSLPKKCNTVQVILINNVVCTFPFELCKYGKKSKDCKKFLQEAAPTKVAKYHPEGNQEVEEVTTKEE